MRILFDQGTPVPLRTLLTRHEVSTVYEKKAEISGYEALVTTDQNLRYQQHLAGRKLAIAILKTTSWPRIEAQGQHVIARIDGLQRGGYVEIEVP